MSPDLSRRRRTEAIAAFLIAAVLAGCSSHRSGGWTGGRRTSQDFVNMALEAQCADDRREGVSSLARTRDASTDWAVKVFETVARTDTDAPVRCAAVRALERSAGPDRVPLLLSILDGSAGTGDKTRMGPVRWEAAKLLRVILRDGLYDETQRAAITRVLLDRAAREPDRNARLAALEGLGHLPDRQVFYTLVDLLEAEDFAIKHAAEKALINLTGTTHDHDAAAWRRWAEEHPAAFGSPASQP